MHSKYLPCTAVRLFAWTLLAAPLFAQRPQDPRPPYPYESRDITFENRKVGLRLAGALTLPPGKGPFPGAVLVNGSGRQNRDDAIFGHKPFLVLADFLTRRGVAVLRYDDRGEGGSEGVYDTATTAELSTDAEAALEWLRARPELDPSRCGIVGHSEGGVIAPMVAARNSSVAFVVSLGGTAVTGAEVLYQQGIAIRTAMGAPPDLMKEREQHERVIAALRERDPAVAEQKLHAVFGDSPAAEQQAKALVSPWLRFYVEYDPAPALEKVRCPVLAVNGGRDLQVSADQNLPAFEAALKKGGNRDITVQRLPGLNHLFQTCARCTPDEYGEIEETLAPKALDLIAGWISERFGTTSRRAGKSGPQPR